MTAKRFYYILQTNTDQKSFYKTLPDNCVYVDYEATFEPGKLKESIEKYRDKDTFICIETNTSFDTGKTTTRDDGFTTVKCAPEVPSDIIFSTEHKEFFKRTENNVYKRIREIDEDAPDNGITERITIVQWNTIPKYNVIPILDRS